MKSILNEIKKRVEMINWSTPTKKERALDVCIAIYNIYIYDGGDFYSYRSLSKEFFQRIIRTKNYLYEIKDGLVDNNILEMHNSYDVNKGIGKGYRFNRELIRGEYVKVASKGASDVIENENEITDQNSVVEINYSSNYLLNTISLYHNCGTNVKGKLLKDLSELKFDDEVSNWISNFKVDRLDVKVNNEIMSEYVNIVFDNSNYRYRLDNALQLSKEQGKDLVEYKDKCYIENVDDFIERKSNDLRLVYSKSVFDVRNGIFRISRNNHNRRMDYNLTNMKSELIDYIKVDGEKLVELDIANAQFAIFSYLCGKFIDDTFIQLSESGNLYSVVDKKRMFRIAFDKVKKEQDSVRFIFPKTMEYVDKYKRINGYKSFSQLLQSAESLIMIDGVMNRLVDSGLRVYPIHDAIRVRESDVDSVKRIIDEFFMEIGFRCNLRVKNRKK